MTNYFTGMTTSDYIYLGTILLFGLIILWLALIWKDMSLKIADHERQMAFMCGREEKYEDIIDEQADALADKDRIIESVLKAANDKELEMSIELSKAESADMRRREELLGKIVMYQDILNLKVPAYRVLKNDPAKLEAWLKKLKTPKKRERKAEPPKVSIAGNTPPGVGEVWIVNH